MNMSTYLADELLDMVLRGDVWAPPATAYLALFTGDPTAAGTGPEVTGGGYVRKSIPFAVAAGGVCANDDVVVYVASGGDYGAVSHLGIYDTVSGGNLLFFVRLTTEREVLDGNTLTFQVGSITATLV